MRKTENFSLRQSGKNIKIRVREETYFSIFICIIINGEMILSLWIFGGSTHIYSLYLIST